MLDASRCTARCGWKFQWLQLASICIGDGDQSALRTGVHKNSKGAVQSRRIHLRLRKPRERLGRKQIGLVLCPRRTEHLPESGLAERQGFEPWVPAKVQRFSRPPRSTAPAPLPHQLHGPLYIGVRQNCHPKSGNSHDAGFSSHLPQRTLILGKAAFQGDLVVRRLDEMWASSLVKDILVCLQAWKGTWWAGSTACFRQGRIRA